MIQTPRIVTFFFYFLIVYFCVGPRYTDAHPHMFIDYTVKFMIDNKGVTGIYIYWQFDELHSNLTILDFDKDKNMVLSKSEQKRLYNKRFVKSAKDNFFAAILYGLEYVRLKEVQEFKASIKNDKNVLYSFYVPLNLPIEEIPDGLLCLYFEDPTMYVDFYLRKKMVRVSNSGSNIEAKVSFSKLEYKDKITLTLNRMDAKL